MPKIYKVTGESRVRPVGLPEGFEVEEENKAFRLRIPAPVGWSLIVADDGEGVSLAPHDHRGRAVDSIGLDRDGVIALRKALDEWLGDSASSRVFRDGDNDLWFEVKPAVFHMSYSWEGANRKAPEDGNTMDYVRSWRPLTDVTSDYPRPTN